MGDLKKTIFGGYKKSSVDTEIKELNGRLDEVEADKKRWMREKEAAEYRISELEQKISALAAENEQLRDAAEEKDGVFGDVAKIYRRAYNSGREVVCDSIASAQKFSDNLENRFVEIMGTSNTVIDKYDSANREIENLFHALSQNIGSVAQTTSLMLEKAREFSKLYGEMKNTIGTAQKSTEQILTEYEEQASEFLYARSSPTSSETVTEEASVQPMPETVIPVTEEIQKEFTNEPADPVLNEEVTETAETVEETASEKVTDFTQFGRKSKISPQDRSELLRKALLRNGSN